MIETQWDGFPQELSRIYGNVRSDRGYATDPTLVGTPAARAFPNSSYDPSTWPYDGNNRLVSGTFDCMPAAGSSPYGAAGNVLCDGSAASLTAKQYSWNAESHLTRLNAQPGSGNTYYPAAGYLYDTLRQRVRADQYSTNGSSSSWREYTYFGG